MDYLPDDAVLHTYRCSVCTEIIRGFFIPDRCNCSEDQLWLIADVVTSSHTYDSGQIIQYDSIHSVEEYVDCETEKEDLDKATREMERLRRGIGVENATRDCTEFGEAEI
jgi:hypothetical protein